MYALVPGIVNAVQGDDRRQIRLSLDESEC